MPDDAFTIDRFLGLPRVGSLALSPAGDRLVASVAAPDAEGKKYVSALWELDPGGRRPPRRLTRSAPGESGAAFCPDGSLVFLSARPDPEAAADDGSDDVTALWHLPAGPGEARLMAAPPGGVDAVAVARDAGTLVLGAKTHPGADGWDADRKREQARKDAEVSAQLFESYPIRYWDAYLGPRERRLYVGPAPGADPTGAAPASGGRGGPEPTDLTPRPDRGLDQTSFAVTPDGALVVTGWARDRHDPQRLRVDLVAIDAATGDQRVLAADGAVYGSPACSPDNRLVACVRSAPGSPDGPGETTLWLLPLNGGQPRDLTPGLDLAPQDPVWAPDGSAVFFTADQRGLAPVFRVDVADGTVTRLTGDGAYTALCPSPDSRHLYALRSTVAALPQAVRLDASEADQDPVMLPSPGDEVVPPGRVERVTATASDGATVESWLVTPPGASVDHPAPLVVFIHGGPVSSWNGWHWRWNPHLFAERGYAVLLPDPALSTGYGIDFIRRGWGRWGAEPYTDLLAAVDAATARPDIDADRTAAMGGSFGGYMANWVAGHTDRFRAVVTHASLWSLDQFHGTTDLGVWWEREFGDPYADPSRYREHSPDRHVGAIRTPVLVIHGERDFRVPVGEALRLWTDLSRHGVDAKFLYFPDEHHWVLKPQNTRLWYQTILAFLDHHVGGAEWAPPELL